MTDAALAPTALQRLGPRRLIVVACLSSLSALALMVWSVLDPTPLPVMVVMSIGQVLGTLGLVCYVAAVVAYQWRRSKARRASLRTPDAAHADPPPRG
jgi:hypothetical protein